MLSAHIHTHTHNKLWKGDISKQRLSLYWNLEQLFHCAMTVLAGPYRDKKIPLPNLEEALMMEVWYLFKNEEEGGLFPSPLVLWL